ncbi:MAG: hypothetical protein AAFN81_19105 [Bacteroidota bacterium]
MKTPNLFFVLVFAMATACMPYDLTKMKPAQVQTLYQGSLADAVYPTNDKVDNNLFAINTENNFLVRKTINGEEYVLMLSWKGNDKYYKAPYVEENGVYNTGDRFPIWVTAAPQLANWAKTEPRFMKWARDGEKEKVDGRLKQLLGLPPNPAYTYNYFVEFWVKPGDLFRPCPDSEITDSACGASFPATIDSTYQAWINTTRAERFYDPSEMMDKYPWTALGYTYDWSPRNRNHQGLSEYVIRNNSDVIVKQIYATEEYLLK